MTEKIGFVGYECEDIVLYLALWLKKCGKNVVVEDRTEHGMLLRMLGTEYETIKSEDETFIQEVPVTNAVIHNGGYDINLMIFGYRLLHPRLYECDKLVLITDTLPAHASLLSEVEEWGKKEILLIRNYTECKHGLRYLELLTGRKAEKVFCIPWDERDMRIRNSLGTAEYIRMERLSVQMREVLEQLLEFLLSDNTKISIKKVTRREKAWEKWLHFGRRS